jgi:hypothetical protein
MLVVRIAALPQQPAVDVEAVLAAVTRELATLLGEEPAGSWATWDTIEPGRYSEGGVAPSFQPADTHPPLVTVVSFEGRPAALVGRMLTCVAETLGRELGLEPGNVFVTYEEARSGRLFTGGQVVSLD